MQEDVSKLRNEFISRALSTENKEELEALRIEFLGKNGRFTALLKQLKDIDPSERKHVGELLNETKKVLEDTLSGQQRENEQRGERGFDETIPGIKPPIGHIHLISKAIDEISAVFENIGFVRRRYPEVEWDWFAFESLNFTKLHPARDNWETFFVDTPADPKLGPMLLTPHTSSGQAREMLEKVTLPIRMINISKCYRRQSDASHLTMLHQFEGLVIDTNINFVHLKGTIDYFMNSFFGPNRKSRLRPYNFPFTEPSFELDISCDICGGKGCKLCKQGWLELGGAGMVHPNVLKAGNIDAKKYRGFAFGWGVERAYMMKSGLRVPDIRMLNSTDLRFLTQF